MLKQGKEKAALVNDAVAVAEIWLLKEIQESVFQLSYIILSNLNSLRGHFLSYLAGLSHSTIKPRLV